MTSIPEMRYVLLTEAQAADAGDTVYLQWQTASPRPWERESVAIAALRSIAEHCGTTDYYLGEIGEEAVAALKQIGVNP